MVKRREDTPLGVETIEELLRQNMTVHEFDGDLLIEATLVALGEVHRAHAAGAEAINQRIAANLTTGEVERLINRLVVCAEKPFGAAYRYQYGIHGLTQPGIAVAGLIKKLIALRLGHAKRAIAQVQNLSGLGIVGHVCYPLLLGQVGSLNQAKRMNERQRCHFAIAGRNHQTAQVRISEIANVLANGGFVIPGLGDLHVHSLGDPDNALRRDLPRSNLTAPYCLPNA
jgi:hypothetical protein